MIDHTMFFLGSHSEKAAVRLKLGSARRLKCTKFKGRREMEQIMGLDLSSALEHNLIYEGKLRASSDSSAARATKLPSQGSQGQCLQHIISVKHR